MGYDVEGEILCITHPRVMRSRPYMLHPTQYKVAKYAETGVKMRVSSRFSKYPTYRGAILVQGLLMGFKVLVTHEIGYTLLLFCREKVMREFFCCGKQMSANFLGTEEVFYLKMVSASDRYFG